MNTLHTVDEQTPQTCGLVRHLRVVMVLENCSYPLDTRVRCEAETLAQMGHCVTVLCPRDPQQAWRETIHDVRIIRFPAPPSGRGLLGYVTEFSYTSLILAMLVLVVWMRSGVDVVHVHNPPDTLFVAGLLPKLAGKWLVYDHHDLSPELYCSKYDRTSKRVERFLRTMEYWSCRLADTVITVNESYRLTDQTRNQVVPQKIHVIRNGPDLNRVYLRPIDPELRQRAATIIAYVGTMNRQDGVDHLIRALGHLSHDLNHHNWYCVLIGRCRDAATLEALAKELGIGEQVKLAGYVPDETMLAWLSTADICVAPDPSNPLNDRSTMIKILEYMALGKPIVAYNLPEHRVSAGNAGLFARPNDPLDFARQLARLIDDPVERQTLGQRGQQRIQESLGWDYSAGRLRGVYEQIAERFDHQEKTNRRSRQTPS